MSAAPRLHVSLTTLWALDLSAPIPAPALFARSLTPSELPRLRPLTQQPVGELACRYSRGSRCVAVEVDDTIASYCWVSNASEQIGESESILVLPPGDAYVWDCLTVPPLRGRGLYPSLLRHIARQLQQTGYRRLWIAAGWSNRASRRGMAKAGFQHVASILHLCLGRWRLTAVLPTASAPLSLVEMARKMVVTPRGAGSGDARSVAEQLLTQ